ncbi:MAG: hypothetical protein KatS3mg118_2645 [Paracoccaceae bacterium]|nr:MAG: hypothetical protein KatS3mg118_2645 [Paracoccaceae bacterium]
MPIVTRNGFAPVPPADFHPPEAAAALRAAAIDLPNDADPERLAPHFDRVALIRIPFPVFADGRGFSLARRLRDLGYRGRLRAAGHLIADQFRLALACGFDEVEIDDALAARQPEHLWRPETGPDPRARLRGRAAG